MLQGWHTTGLSGMGELESEVMTMVAVVMESKDEWDKRASTTVS